MALEATKVTMVDLCEHFLKHYCTVPVYTDSRKVSGLRSHAGVKHHINIIGEHFGCKPLRSITHNDLKEFKLLRLNTPTCHGTSRAIGTVNREMAYLRRLLTLATQHGWLNRNVFLGGDSLISLADEKPRDRILTRDEEMALLNVCTGRRKHLRAILICGLDTAMRRGEMIKLTWQNVDLEKRIIFIEALNTKTLKERYVSITNRLLKELVALKEKANGKGDSLVFGITDSFKTAFNNAAKAAHLEDFRFHDIRHTSITKLIQAGMDIHSAGKLAGHTNVATTFRYLNVDHETAQQAAKIFESYQDQTD